MHPLPSSSFDVVTYARMKTDEYGRICLEGRRRCSTDPSLGCTGVVVGKAASEIRIYTADGELAAAHERAYGEAPTDSSDPSAQLSLLCMKQNGWQSSRVRATLPEGLREAMDSMEKPVRGAALRALRDVSARSGYANAIEAARAGVELLGRVDESAVEVMARAMADGRGAIAYDQEVGLDDYDAMFMPIGEVI